MADETVSAGIGAAAASSVSDATAGAASVKSTGAGWGLSGLISQLQTVVSLTKQAKENLASLKQGGVNGPGSPMTSNFAKGTFSSGQSGSGGMNITGMMKLGMIAGTMLPAYNSAVGGAVDRSYAIGTSGLAQGLSYGQEQQRFLGLYTGSGYGLTAPQATQAARTAQMMGMGNLSSRIYMNLAGSSALLNPYGNPQALAQGMMNPSSFYMNRMFGMSMIRSDGSPNPQALRQLLMGRGPGSMNLGSLLNQVGGKRAQQLIAQEFTNPTLARQMLVARFGGNQDAANSFIAYAEASAKAGKPLNLDGKTMSKIMGGDYAGGKIASQQAAQRGLGAAGQDTAMAAFDTQLGAETVAMKLATVGLGQFHGVLATATGGLIGLTAAIAPLLGQLALLRVVLGGVVKKEAASEAAMLAKGGVLSKVPGLSKFSSLSKSGKVGAVGAAIIAAQSVNYAVNQQKHSKANFTSWSGWGHTLADPTANLAKGVGHSIWGAITGAKDLVNSAIGAVDGGHIPQANTDSGTPARGGGSGAGLPNSGSLLSYAKSFIGTPYVWGGSTPKGFDCSGFVQYVFAHFGVSLPRTSQEQQRVGTPIKYSQARPGDLLFWGNPAHHVAIYLGGNQMIAAPHTGDHVKIEPVYGSPSVRRVLKAGGVNNSQGSGVNSNPMGTGAGISGFSRSDATGDNGDSGGGIAGLSSADIAARIAAGLGSGGGGGYVAGTQSAGANLNMGGGGTNDAGGVSSSGRSYSGKQLKFSQLEALAKGAGFGSLSHTMAAIAMAESGGHPKDHNAVPPDNSYGLWQINMLGSMGPGRRGEFGIKSNDALYDPSVNAHAAHLIYNQQGLGAWSTYSSGAYRQFMNMHAKGAWELAQDEVAKVHKGEMIIPAREAESIRQSFSSSGRGYAPISINMGGVTITKATEDEAERLATMVVEKVRDKMLMDTLGGR